ncbi:MAG: rhamnogalacturonan acetylesterase [Nibricoccus sp.]
MNLATILRPAALFALLSAAFVQSLAAAAIEDAPLAPVGPKAKIHPALHLVGDSTMADKPIDKPNPERGWGQLFPTLLKEPARVVNHAQNGRSSKSFREEGRWQNVLEQIEKGDFVLIEFGHNDQKSQDPKRYAAAETDFKDNLRRFIHEATAKGASVLLASPVNRRKFDDKGQLTETLGAYPDAMRAVASEEKVPLIDLHKLTRPVLEKLGPENSKSLFVWVKPGEYAILPKGREDDTHFNEKGALAVSELVATDLRAQKHPLADWLK